MSNRSKDYHIGPGAASLMLIVVVLSMSVLAMLAMMNSRSDNRLSSRSAEVTEQVYALDAKAEYSLAELDGWLAQCAAQTENDEDYLALIAQSLPADVQLDERTVNWQEYGEGGRSLLCAVRIAPHGTFPRAEWTEHKLYTELEETSSWIEETIWAIWD